MDTVSLFEFDDGAAWIPDLLGNLGPHLPGDVAAQLRSSQIDDPSSAGQALRALAGADRLFAQTRAWLLERDVAAYHGSRLDEEQRRSVARDGLRLLVPEEREDAIRSFLSSHPQWSEVEHRLPEAIASLSGHRAGRRAGQVHAAISRSGLVNGCNHYLVEGSEFDHHVAHYLLGEAVCHDQNKARGEAILYRVRLDGAAALEAANPFGLSDEPNLVREMLDSLAWCLATGDSDTAAQEVDCCLILYRAVPPADILGSERIADEILWENYDNRAR